MCATCGCETNGHSIIHEFDHSHHHPHNGEEHEHSHTLPTAIGTHHHKTVIEVEQDVLHQNNLLAERNRGYFEAKNILALNLVSSPGSGKTTLLEKTLTKLKNQIDFYLK